MSSVFQNASTSSSICGKRGTGRDGIGGGAEGGTGVGHRVSQWSSWRMLPARTILAGPRYHLACHALRRDHSHCGCDGPAPLGSTERFPRATPFFRELPVDGRIDARVSSVRVRTPSGTRLCSPRPRPPARRKRCRRRTLRSKHGPHPRVPPPLPASPLPTCRPCSSPRFPRAAPTSSPPRLDLNGTVDLAYSTLEQCILSARRRRHRPHRRDGRRRRHVRCAHRLAPHARCRCATGADQRAGVSALSTLSEALISELDLRDVRIDYLNLGAGQDHDLEISGCSIRTIDMPQAELSRVRFTATSSDEVDPRGMRAKDVDLRGLDAVAYLDAHSLRGATTPPRSRCSSSPGAGGGHRHPDQGLTADQD